MKNYDTVEYWNTRKNPCSNIVGELTPTHIKYLTNQIRGCKNILDFGPGYGRLFSSYKGIKKLTAIDVTIQHKNSLENEAKKYGFEFEFILNSLNFSKQDFPDKYFDTTVTSEVLLHQTPDIVEDMMTELLRISKKVIVISYMNLKEKYDETGNYTPDHRYCFNYDYHKICKNNKWELINEERIRNQIMFVYK